MKLFLLAVVALCAIVQTEAKCSGSFVGGSMQLCSVAPGWKKGGGGVIKDWTVATCVASGTSPQQCLQVPAGGPFIAGRSDGAYTCNVYGTTNCRGKYVSVEVNGRFDFPGITEAKSFRCPCRKP
jgi:hypothetical protein